MLTNMTYHKHDLSLTCVSNYFNLITNRTYLVIHRKIQILLLVLWECWIIHVKDLVLELVLVREALVVTLWP